MIIERYYGPDDQIPNLDPREMLRGAMNTINQQPNTGLLPAELAAIDNICNQVEMHTRDQTDTDEQAWHRAALATKAILRSHTEDVI